MFGGRVVFCTAPRVPRGMMIAGPEPLGASTSVPPKENEIPDAVALPTLHTIVVGPVMVKVASIPSAMALPGVHWSD